MQGAEIIVYGTCVNERELSKGELVKSVRIGTMMQLALWIKESQKVLSF